MSSNKTYRERFWKKLNNAEDCWLWIGAKNKAGYGNMKYKGKYVNAHRVSYLLNVGDIPEGYYVCHECDNPSCVNPNHLFLGLPIENDRDKVKKGRQIKGETHPMAKLTDRQVHMIRKQDGTHGDIAKEYGVSRSLISMIKRGDIWRV